jgi:glucokinase
MMAGQIAVADIGGTHARFALARLEGAAVTALGEPFVCNVADHAALADAWRAFAATLGSAAPRCAALAVAAPADADIIRFTNSHWQIDRATLADELGLERLLILNDFGAVAHAVAAASPSDFVHLSGPDMALPNHGVTSVVGPGTGLGVAQVLRTAQGFHVIETEGGHQDFAPCDAVDDTLLEQLRDRFGRVSVERLVAGPGLKTIHDALYAADGWDDGRGDRSIWAAALAGDGSCEAALTRYCAILGTVVGDMALAHGADSVVLAGSLAGRIRHWLDRDPFVRRFVRKGRFEARMRAIPIRLFTPQQPGLLGAAVAYARHARSS